MLWSDLLILLPSLIGFWILVRRSRPFVGDTATQDTLPENAIVVDGSNVMHWGEGASAMVLSRVLHDITKKGHHPIIFFDANVGYVLDDHYYDEAKLAQVTGVSERQICVVSKGIVADQSILLFASDHGLRIVTNDRFRDWRVQFPHADKKGVLVGGTWREGSVVWRGKL